MANAYDEIAYPSMTFWQTHPDKLATHAILFGLPYAQADRCRYLEIGAGDGSNIIPMAQAYPESRFVGFDLAGEPVARGRAAIEALGLTNIELIQADILEVQLGEAPFDYIVAHGFYAWTPPNVRDAMMRLIGQLLAPQGMAYVSYNALPGAYFRLMVRNQVLFATRDVEGRAQRLEAALPHLRKLAEQPAGEGPFGELMAQNAQVMLDIPASALAHDALGDNYNPVHLHEFNRHCADNGLQIVTNSVPAEEFFWFTDSTDGDAGIIERMQTHDFDHVQYFHRSILVRDGVAIDRRLLEERLRSLWVSLAAEAVNGDGFAETRDLLSASDPSYAAVIDKFAAVWPAAAKVADIARKPGDIAGLVRLCRESRATFHAAPTAFNTRIGDRPMASPLSRLQARRGDTRLTTLRHEMLQLDKTMRDFIASLDGTRSRLEIARDAAAEYKVSLEFMLERLDIVLPYLARAPFLVR